MNSPVPLILASRSLFITLVVPLSILAFSLLHIPSRHRSLGLFLPILPLVMLFVVSGSIGVSSSSELTRMVVAQRVTELCGRFFASLIFIRLLSPAMFDNIVPNRSPTSESFLPHLTSSFSINHLSVPPSVFAFPFLLVLLFLGSILSLLCSFSLVVTRLQHIPSFLAPFFQLVASLASTAVFIVAFRSSFAQRGLVLILATQLFSVAAYVVELAGIAVYQRGGSSPLIPDTFELARSLCVFFWIGTLMVFFFLLRKRISLLLPSSTFSPPRAENSSVFSASVSASPSLSRLLRGAFDSSTIRRSTSTRPPSRMHKPVPIHVPSSSISLPREVMAGGSFRTREGYSDFVLQLEVTDPLAPTLTGSTTATGGPSYSYSSLHHANGGDEMLSPYKIPTDGGIRTSSYVQINIHPAPIPPSPSDDFLVTLRDPFAPPPPSVHGSQPSTPITPTFSSFPPASANRPAHLNLSEESESSTHMEGLGLGLALGTIRAVSDGLGKPLKDTLPSKPLRAKARDKGHVRRVLSDPLMRLSPSSGLSLSLGLGLGGRRHTEKRKSGGQGRIIGDCPDTIPSGADEVAFLACLVQNALDSPDFLAVDNHQAPVVPSEPGILGRSPAPVLRSSTELETFENRPAELGLGLPIRSPSFSSSETSLIPGHPGGDGGGSGRMFTAKAPKLRFSSSPNRLTFRNHGIPHPDSPFRSMFTSSILEPALSPPRSRPLSLANDDDSGLSDSSPLARPRRHSSLDIARRNRPPLGSSWGRRMSPAHSHTPSLTSLASVALASARTPPLIATTQSSPPQLSRVDPSPPSTASSSSSSAPTLSSRRRRPPVLNLDKVKTFGGELVPSDNRLIQSTPTSVTASEGRNDTETPGSLPGTAHTLRGLSYTKGSPATTGRNRPESSSAYQPVDTYETRGHDVPYFSSPRHSGEFSLFNSAFDVTKEEIRRRADMHAISHRRKGVKSLPSAVSLEAFGPPADGSVSLDGSPNYRDAAPQHSKRPVSAAPSHITFLSMSSSSENSSDASAVSRKGHRMSSVTVTYDPIRSTPDDARKKDLSGDAGYSSNRAHDLPSSGAADTSQSTITSRTQRSHLPSEDQRSLNGSTHSSSVPSPTTPYSTFSMSSAPSSPILATPRTPHFVTSGLSDRGKGKAIVRGYATSARSPIPPPFVDVPAPLIAGVAEVSAFQSSSNPSALDSPFEKKHGSSKAHSKHLQPKSHRRLATSHSGHSDLAFELQEFGVKSPDGEDRAVAYRARRMGDDPSDSGYEQSARRRGLDLDFSDNDSLSQAPWFKWG